VLYYCTLLPGDLAAPALRGDCQPARRVRAAGMFPPPHMHVSSSSYDCQPARRVRAAGMHLYLLY